MADVLEVPKRTERILPELTESVEGRVVRHADHPIDFETFLDISFITHGDFELISGVLVERILPQLTHERLFGWLSCIAGMFVSHQGLGIVLGSRTAVEINRYSGRLPDLLFVRQERATIVRERAVYGAPDLVVEIVSPHDHSSDLIAAETDYRTLGVGEIVFIDMTQQRVRIVQLEGTEYAEETLTTGEWRSHALLGLNLQVSWLLTEPRPDMLDTLQTFLNAV